VDLTTNEEAQTEPTFLVLQINGLEERKSRVSEIKTLQRRECAADVRMCKIFHKTCAVEATNEQKSAKAGIGGTKNTVRRADKSRDGVVPSRL
jgi:hypothetical protein